MVITLRIIGALAILGGFFIGLDLYEVPIEGYRHLTEKDWTIFFTWFGYGIISGILFFAFAQILDHLETKNDYAEKQINILERLEKKLDKKEG